MKEKDLKKLAQDVQLEINNEQMQIYLETFAYLEKLLINFKKVKLDKKVRAMKRINVGCLTLKELKKISEKFSVKRTTKKILKINSTVDNSNFILYKKRDKLSKSP